MFAKCISKIKALPPRTSDWVNRAGPVAVFGYGAGCVSSAGKALSHFYSASRDCDFYAELRFHDEAPIECPPESVLFMPVLKCGEMLPTEGTAAAAAAPGPSRDDWYLGATEIATELLEKGYIPVSVGGDGSATLAMVESYKRLNPTDDVVLLHFSARPTVGDPKSPVRVLLEKGLVKGIVGIGNRCVNSEDRKIRKQYKMFYMDMHAIFAKGLFCIRDVRNDFPVFISINADVLDPAFAPAVADPVPGGLSTRELLHIVSGIRGPNVIGADIHGYRPELDIVRGTDGLGLTQMAMAKLIKETILKTYVISTQTEEQGLERIKMMQRDGTLAPNPYPDH